VSAGYDELRDRVRQRGYDLTKNAADLLVDRLQEAAGDGLRPEAVRLTTPVFSPNRWSVDLAVTSVGTTWQWVYGDSPHPFDPHVDLDGVTFDLTTYLDVLAKDPGDFPEGTSFWYPGDHSGCSCVAAPVIGTDAFDPTGQGGTTTSLRVGRSTVTITREAQAPDQIVPDWWQNEVSPEKWAAALEDVT
jgi:hypothetical protein